MSKKPDRPTEEMYRSLQRGYDHFNKTLFEGELPQCLITLKRLKRAVGYFSPGAYRLKRGKRTTHEITLCTSWLGLKTEQDMASTLVHEMAHLWQDEFGKPGRRGYHNRQWATKMEEVGLQPSTTGEPGGKRTGERVTHYIIRNGVFEESWKKLKGSGYRVAWADPAKPGSSPQLRARFECLRCHQPTIFTSPPSWLSVCRS